MSIQQYGARSPLSDPPLLGDYILVTYADHVAAMTAAEEKWSTFLGVDVERNIAYEQGVSDDRERIRKAVMWMPNPMDSADLLPVIDNEGKP